MRVLFVSSFQAYCSVEKPLYDQNAIPQGVSYVSSFIKQAGHETRMAALTPDTSRRVLDRAIEEFQPGIVGFTSIFSEYAFIRETAAYVKGKYPELYLIAGGPHVSLNPEEAIKDAFDGVCIGEGEHPTLELIEQIEQGKAPNDIPNWWFKHEGAIQKNPTRPFIQDLDTLPFADREMWREWIDDVDTTPCILLGRGCPYSCTYCCNHTLRKLATGNYVRFRSADNVIAELREFSSRHPLVSEVYFEVETIGAKEEYAAELCAKLQEFNRERAQPLAFSVNLRITPNKDFGPFFSLLKAANFTSINIGLESGSPRIRSEVLKRRYSNEDVLNAVEAARVHGLNVSLYVLEGLPGETWADFQETVQCTRACKPDFYYLSIFTPYPGTELYDKCVEMNLLHDGLNMKLERRRPVLDLPGFSRKQIRREYLLFAYKVYRGVWSPASIAKKLLGTWIRSSALMHKVYKLFMRTPRFQAFRRRAGWQW